MIDKIVRATEGSLREALESQLATAIVSADCSLCPSIELTVDRTGTPVLSKIGTRFGGVAPVMLYAGTRGDSTRAILHINDGLMTELEFFRDDGELVRSLPDPDAMSAEPIE